MPHVFSAGQKKVVLGTRQLDTVSGHMVRSPPPVPDSTTTPDGAPVDSARRGVSAPLEDVPCVTCGGFAPKLNTVYSTAKLVVEMQMDTEYTAKMESIPALHRVIMFNDMKKNLQKQIQIHIDLKTAHCARFGYQ